MLHVSAVPSHIEISDGTVNTRKYVRATRGSMHVRATSTGYNAASAWMKISLHQHTALVRTLVIGKLRAFPSERHTLARSSPVCKRGVTASKLDRYWIAVRLGRYHSLHEAANIAC